MLGVNINKASVTQMLQRANGANRANGATRPDRTKGAEGPIGPMGPLGPGAQQDQWGPMAPLANRISTTTPKSRGRGGSLAYTSLLAWVELNLSLSTSTPPPQQEAIQIETSASVLGIANSVFDRHACAVHLKKNNCNALPVPFKTGFFGGVLGGANSLNNWSVKAPKPPKPSQNHQKIKKTVKKLVALYF